MASRAAFRDVALRRISAAAVELGPFLAKVN